MTTCNHRSSANETLEAPRPFEGRMTLSRFARMYRDSTISVFRKDAYEEDLVERRFWGRHSFVVNSPEAIKHVLLDNAKNYTKPEIMRRVLEPGLGVGLLTSEGALWRRYRRIVAPAFDHRNSANYSSMTVAVAETLLQRWSSRGDDDAIVSINEEMMSVTLQVISRAIFSIGSDEIADVVTEAVERYQSEVRPGLVDILGFPRWISRFGPLRGARRIFSAFDASFARLLAARAQDRSQNSDLLARLIAARESEGGDRLTAREVRDQVATILMAGHETTANALSWAWYLIALHPCVEAKLHAELDKVLCGRLPRGEDVPMLKYTRMVIEETMRLYPPAHTVPRQAIGEDRILGRSVPAKALVMIVPWLLHRHRKYWNDPDRFDPDRFLPDHSATRHRFAYIPFGSGPRVCIGASFALNEMILLLAAIAQKYRLRLVDAERVEPQALITLRPRNGIRMAIESR
jgi:cytochrome P450